MRRVGAAQGNQGKEHAEGSTGRSTHAWGSRAAGRTRGGSTGSRAVGRQRAVAMDR